MPWRKRILFRSTSALISSGDKGLDVVAMVVGRRRVGLDDETVLKTHVSGKQNGVCIQLGLQIPLS